jgi:Flp pilus assembly protein TadG
MRVKLCWMRNKRKHRGGSAVEFALLSPWVFFLFVGAFDWGFYAHALISTENATRVAALYGANLSGGTVSTTEACTLVLNELSIASNVAGLSGCTGPVSDTQPVVLAVTCTTLDSVHAVQVAVTYRTLQLIPIPGLLSGKVTLYRTAQMPMKSNTACATS